MYVICVNVHMLPTCQGIVYTHCTIQRRSVAVSVYGSCCSGMLSQKGKDMGDHLRSTGLLKTTGWSWKMAYLDKVRQSDNL